jgi:hypothetical protein
MMWIVLIVILALIIFAIKGAGSKKGNLPYSKVDVLFSPAENLFLSVLEHAANEYKIFGKVRMADIVAVKKIENKSHWQKAFNKIALKHFDFVLCDKTTLKVIAIIELDDSTHNRKKEKENDEVKNSICDEIKLPLIRVKASNKYDETLLRNMIAEGLKKYDVA